MGVGTIRFMVVLHGLLIRVLVDEGSVDNFSQPWITYFLKFPIELVSSFKVMVGNMNNMAVKGIINDLSI